MLPEKAAIAVSGLIFLAAGIDAIVRRGRSEWIGAGLFVGSMLLAIGIGLRWERVGEGPFMTLFEVLLSNLFSLGFIYACLFWRLPPVRPALPTVALLLALLSVWALMSPGQHVTLPPTFEHPWLWVHVVTGKIFLGLCMTAAGLSLTALLPGGQEIRDATIWNLLAAAFVFHGAMLVAGAVWAHDAWGRYWSWDPLEVWSLITWLALAALLHARVTYSMRPPLGQSLVILVFGLAFLTFFGVPFVSQAPHKGVM